MLKTISDITWVCPTCDVLVYSVAQPADCDACDTPGEDFELVSDLAANPKWVEVP